MILVHLGMIPQKVSLVDNECGDKDHECERKYREEIDDVEGLHFFLFYFL